MTWNDSFLALFDRSVSAYHGGNRNFESYYEPPDLALLDDLGYKTREFFDFVEDHCDEGSPSPSTALLVAAVRRDYHHTIMQGCAPERLLTADDMPTFGDALDDIAYLPRIIAKARAKLRGELDPDLMFGCGGDRKFLRDNGNIHPADFLRQVWAARDDDSKLATWVRSRIP